jgi:hypothetical protein
MRRNGNIAHFSISVAARRGFYFTKKPAAITVKTILQPNAMVLAELDVSEDSICDASLSSHQSNVLLHHGLHMV